MHLRPVVAVLAGALLLAGCTSTATPDASVTPSPSSDGSTASEESTEPTEAGEESEATRDAKAGSQDAQCLVGEWDQDFSGIVDAMQTAVAAEDTAATTTVTGESILSFDGSTMRATYSGFTLEIAVEVAGQEMRMTTAIDGESSAPYTATGTTLTLGEIDSSAVTTEISMSIAGQELELPDTALDAAGASPDADLAGSSEYTCTDTELRITPDIENAEDFAQVLTRR